MRSIGLEMFVKIARNTFFRKYISKDAFVFSLLAIMVFIFKAGVINQPFHWDALQHVGYALRLAYQHIFPARLSGLLFFFLALCYKLFGFSIPLTHIIILVFSSVTLLFTYKLACYLADKHIACGSALLLFFSPLFFAQTGIVNLAIPATCLGVLSVYYFFKRQFFRIGIFFILACFSTENLVFMIIPLLVVSFAQARTPRKKFYNLLKTATPFLIIFLFFLIAIFYGDHPYLKYYIQRITTEDFFATFKSIFNDFMSKHILVLYCLGLAPVYLIIRKKEKNTQQIQMKHLFLFLIIFILVFLALFTLYPFYLIRHWLPTYPFMAIAASFLLGKSLADKRTAYYVAVFVMTIYSLYASYRPFVATEPSGSGVIMEANMSYFNIVRSHKLMAEYVEHKYPEKTIATFWPMEEELRYPGFGYVQRPLKVRDLFFNIFFDPLNVDLAIEILNLAPDSFDFLVYSPQAHGTDKVYAYIQKHNFKPVYTVEVNGCTTSLYKRD